MTRRDRQTPEACAGCAAGEPILTDAIGFIEKGARVHLLDNVPRADGSQRIMTCALPVADEQGEKTGERCSGCGLDPGYHDEEGACLRAPAAVDKCGICGRDGCEGTHKCFCGSYPHTNACVGLPEPAAVVEKCAGCDGSGHLQTPGDQVCPDCHGTGIEPAAVAATGRECAALWEQLISRVWPIEKRPDLILLVSNIVIAEKAEKDAALRSAREELEKANEWHELYTAEQDKAESLDAELRAAREALREIALWGCRNSSEPGVGCRSNCESCVARAALAGPDAKGEGD